MFRTQLTNNVHIPYGGQSSHGTPLTFPVILPPIQDSYGGQSSHGSPSTSPEHNDWISQIINQDYFKDSSDGSVQHSATLSTNPCTPSYPPTERQLMHSDASATRRSQTSRQRELVGGVEREAAAAHSIFEPVDSMHDTLPSHSETERYLRRSLGIPPHKPVHLKSWPGVHPFCGTRLLTLEQAIQLAIWSSPEKRLKIQQIYDALQDRYPILRMDPDKRWMRSIRHKLSHMHMFRQPYRHWSYPRRGKGDYWLIDISKGTGNKAAAKKKSTKTDSSVSSDSGHEYSSPESGSSITLSPVPHSYIKLAAEDSGQYSGNPFLLQTCVPTSVRYDGRYQYGGKTSTMGGYLMINITQNQKPIFNRSPPVLITDDVERELKVPATKRRRSSSETSYDDAAHKPDGSKKPRQD